MRGLNGEPEEVVTDLARALRHVIEELLPAAFHDTERYANNRVESDHGRLKARLRPMRGLKTDPTASVIIRGHACMQNLRRGHYALGIDARSRHLLVAAAFDELAQAICSYPATAPASSHDPSLTNATAPINALRWVARSDSVAAAPPVTASTAAWEVSGTTAAVRCRTDRLSPSARRPVRDRRIAEVSFTIGSAGSDVKQVPVGRQRTEGCMRTWRCATSRTG